MSTLTPDLYAQLLARLAVRRRAHVGDILAELGISAEELRDGEPALRAQLAQAWPRRQGILAMKFATALATELNLLGPIGIEGTGGTAAPSQPDVVVPTYLRDPPASPSAAIGLPAAVSELLGPHREAPAPSLAATSEADISAIVAGLRRGALPFAPGKDAAKPDLGPPSAVAPPPPPGGSAPTMELPAMQAPDEPDLSAFPLEVYASITGALARGESRDEALARHRLGAETFDKLAKAWAARFAKEPHLLARFKELARAGAASERRGDP